MSNTPSHLKKHYWLVFQQDCLLLLNPEAEQPFPDEALVLPLKTNFIREHLLLQDENSLIYCAEIAENSPITAPFTIISLRNALEALGSEWYTIAAKAYSIIHWDKNHRFCGRCGAATFQPAERFERVCSNCSLTFYPRISPSIIVLIKRGDEVLMARSAHFKPGVYAFIAGFVEPGETIEDAVHREVKEEVGITIKNLQYFGSQAWPFPDSLMLAFYADYDSGELQLDPFEIEDAGWYHYNHLPGRPSSQVSIAAKLLDHYLRSKQA